MRAIRLSALAVLLAATVWARGGDAVSTNTERGFDPQKAYAVDEVGAVNVFNGNLNATLPIGPAYRVSSALSYQLALHYGGNNWRYTQYDVLEGCQLDDSGNCVPIIIVYDWAYAAPEDNAGFGWRLHLGRFVTETLRTVATGRKYESPDGAEHEFFATLHDGETEVANTYYTRDGSYLRMRVDGTTAHVDSPDGIVRTFDFTSGHASDGRAVKIEDRFGNFVSINYDDPTAPAPSFPGAYTAWKIEDSIGRAHYVYLRPTVDYAEDTGPTPVAHEAIREVRLSMTGGPAVWTFEYENEDTGYTSLPTPDSGPGPSYPDMDQGRVALLGKVNPPVGNGYTFTYDLASADIPSGNKSSGVLKSVTLPTLGSVHWSYTAHAFPVPSPVPVNHKNPPGVSESAGVRSRTIKDSAGNTTAYRTYDATADSADPPLEKSVVITDYASGPGTAIVSKSANFFSLCVRACLGNAYPGEYGLPLTRKAHTGPNGADGSRRLSTITYGPGTNWSEILQSTYVEYDADTDLATTIEGRLDWNRRAKSQKTVHKGTDAWTVSAQTGWDGFGHYRTTVATSSASLGAVSRTTVTNYTPHGSTSTAPPARTSAWLPELFSWSTAADSSSTTRTDFCFNPTTGFLERKRTWRGAAASPSDLLAIFAQTGGEITREAYYGGDNHPLTSSGASSFATCTQTPFETARYALNHTYSNGVRTATQYDEVTFKSVDLTSDLSGFVSSSADTAGIRTYYAYDLLGRLKAVKPCEVTPCSNAAWTTYDYNAATASSPPSVTAKQYLPNIAAAQTETRYYFDHLGRLIQQRNWMAGVATTTTQTNTWSAVQNRFDSLGRQVAASTPVGTTTGSYSVLSSPPETITEYDAMGRVKKTTQPDNTEVVIDQGEAPLHVTRTVSVQTSETAPTPVSSRETFDGLGRLVAVAENSGLGDDAPVTTYQYDAGDRLTRVDSGSQYRVFLYDAAGLLKSEQHPEIGPTGSGTVLYDQYDARGHLVRKTTPAGVVLTMAYDAAERLTSVSTGARTLQSFTYDTAIGAGNGKAATATRYNRIPSDVAGIGGQDITVTEAFRYSDSRGRLTRKTTSLSTGESFYETYTYDGLGALQSLTYPSCTSGCDTLTAPARTVTNEYQQGYLSRVTGYTQGMQYHPNGLLAQVRRVNADGNAGPLWQQAVSLGMARPSTISLSGDCSNLSIQVQPAANSTAPATLTVTAPGATTYQWFIVGQSQSVSSAQSLGVTSVTQPTSYFVRVSNGTCTLDSSPATVNPCTPPDTTISAPATIGPNIEADASVAGTGTYAWTIENGTIVSAANTKTIRFKSNCTGAVVLHVTISGGCPGMGSKSVTVAAPSVTVTATPSTVPAGSSSSLSASVSGTGPWTIAWADDGSTASTRTVTPRSTTTYAVGSVNGCTGSWGSATVTVTAPPPPVNVAATYTGGSVLVTWSAPAGWVIDSYAIDRCDSNGCTNSGGAEAGTSSTTSFQDYPSLNRAYLYRVRARKLDMVSAQSASDLAVTVAVAYPVTGGTTAIQVAHLQQMRAGVDALRVFAGLSAAVYTDAAVAGLAVRTQHVLELRNALNAARATLNFPAISFTDPVLTPLVTPIRAAHFNEIMGAIR